MARGGANAEVAGRIADILNRISWFRHTTWAYENAVDIRIGTSLWGIGERVQTCAAERAVAVCFNDGRLELRSLKDGTAAWKIGPVPEGSRQYQNQSWEVDLWMAGDMLLRVSQTEVRANDFRTGADLWCTSLGFGGMQSPRRDMVLGKKVFVLCTNQKTHAYELSGGKKLWVVDKYASDGVILPEGDVILVTGEGVLRCRESDGRVQWEVASVSHYQERRLILAGKWLVTGSGKFDRKGLWTAVLGSETGKEVWRYAGAFPTAAVASQDGKRLFVAVHDRQSREEGRLIAIEIDSNKILWSERIGYEGMILMLEGPRLLACHYAPRFFGAWLVCLEVDDGNRLWMGQIARDGLSDNSKLFQAVDLEVRRGQAIVKGSIGGSHYVETFRLADGATGSRWRNR